MNPTTTVTPSASLIEADCLEKLATHFFALARAASHPHLLAYRVSMNVRAVALQDRAATLRRRAGAA